MSVSIAIGGDHAGYEYKKEIITFLEAKGVEVKDFGPYSDESCDYPDYIHPMAKAIEKGDYDLGIAICGSANGVNMTANKYANIRAAIAWEKELAVLAKSHNNANVLSLPARFISLDSAKEIAAAFIDTPFEGGRHQRRVDKISP